jgi:hypothetical protein
LLAAVAIPLGAFETPTTAGSAPSGSSVISALWTDRGDVTSLDLLSGIGGKEHQPAGNFTFVKDEKEGTSPKFEVVDAQGVRWKAKLGEESKAEVAATRLVWAAGYFTDEDYYVARLHVDKMPKLSRGQQYVTEDGVVLGVRLERSVKGQKKTGNWSWFKNPYVGTRELNGLKVMMALINNWDLKEINNAVYSEKEGGVHYVVSDLGASFGETGNTITRSKSDPGDYSGTKFIQKVTKDHVDFYMDSRPFVLSAIDIPNYYTRTHMQDVVKSIPVEDARWLGQRLQLLSDEQLRDCFRGAGYSVGEVEEYTSVVRQRIKALSDL